MFKSVMKTLLLWYWKPLLQLYAQGVFWKQSMIRKSSSSKRVIVKLKLYIWNDRTFLANIPLYLWLVYVHVCCNTLLKNVYARQVKRAHEDVEYSDGKKNAVWSRLVDTI